MEETSEHQIFEQDTSKYKKPFKKEIFEFVEQVVKECNPSSLVDIGCASGDFLFGLYDNNNDNDDNNNNTNN